MKTLLLRLLVLLAVSSYLLGFQNESSPIHIKAWFPTFDLYNAFEVEGSGIEHWDVIVTYKSEEHEGEGGFAKLSNGEEIYAITYTDYEADIEYRIYLHGDLEFSATLIVKHPWFYEDVYSGKWKPIG